MDCLFLKWGPFSVTAYSLSIMIALVVALFIYIKECSRKGINPDRMISFALLVILGGVIGARLSHIIFVDYEYYKLDPRQIWSFQDGGLSFLGGFLGAFLLALIFIQLTGSASKRLLDAFVPSVVLANAISRIGNIPAGLPVSSTLPWALEVNGEHQHPDQAYMIIMLYIFFYILWRKRENIVYHGELFVWFLVGYGAISFVVDFFRSTPNLLWIFSLSQIISILMLAAGIYYARKAEKTLAAPVYRYDVEPPPAVGPTMLNLALFSLVIIFSVYLHYLAN